MTQAIIIRIVKVMAIPVAYALFLRQLFVVDDWEQMFSVMSLSFLFCVPVIVGALTVYTSREEEARRIYYRIFAPWAPVAIFLAITISFTLEGWACWIMALPLFLTAASIGGFIGAYFKLRKKDNKTYLSILVLFPFLAAPVENMIGAIPGTYKAYTYIDIKAPAGKIWSNVTRVSAIQQEKDKGWLTKLMGLPRPVSAELNYEGVGAYRAARFTGGLVFHETVSEYIHQKKMVFSIKADPHEIPSTTMDEHIVIGGKFFDVLNGTYELEKLNETTHRLHLYSHFKLHTTFNFYAGWWAKWIMKDIQYNILQVEKERAEKSL